MRSEPTITVTCDGCEKEEIEVGLTTTAHGYDERNLTNAIEAEGWKIHNGKDYCGVCQDDKILEEQ